MPQKHNRKNDIIILGIFRTADPVRQILRDYASGFGYSLFCYDNLFDALGRMPIMDNSCTTVIASRSEAAWFDITAFETLINPSATYYVLWLDACHWHSVRQWHGRRNGLYSVSSLMQFDALLKTFSAAQLPASQNDPPPRPASDRRRSVLRTEPLSKEELNALLGAEQ